MSGLIDQHPAWYLIPVYGVAILVIVTGVLITLVWAGRALLHWVDRRIDKANFERNTYTQTPVHSPAPDPLAGLMVYRRQGALPVTARPGGQATPPVPVMRTAGGVVPHTAADLGQPPECSRSVASHARSAS